MRKMFFKITEIAGIFLMLTTEINAASFLSKLSTVVIIFSIIAGAGIWLYAAKKRRELDD